MAVKKRVTLFLVLLMLGAQLALAHHATIHFNGHGHATHQQEHSDSAPQAYELCQLCIFTKSIAHAVANGTIVQAALLESSYRVPLAQHYITRQYSYGHLPRGPPSLLI